MTISRTESVVTNPWLSQSVETEISYTERIVVRTLPTARETTAVVNASDRNGWKVIRSEKIIKGKWKRNKRNR